MQGKNIPAPNMGRKRKYPEEIIKEVIEDLDKLEPEIGITKGSMVGMCETKRKTLIENQGLTYLEQPMSIRTQQRYVCRLLFL